MSTGTIKFFDPERGWGFIIQPDGSELFVHFSAIQVEGFKTVRQGDTVTYDVVDGEKGKQAANVVVIEHKKPRTKGSKTEE